MDKNTRDHKILLVDDQEDFLLSTSKVLNREGFDVELAPNSVTALEKLEGTVFDVVVLNIIMPDIDSHEVLGQIRERYPGLPVILLTGQASSDNGVLRDPGQGATVCLTKGMAAEELIQHIRQVIVGLRNSTVYEAQVPFEDSERPVRVMIVDDEVEFLESLRKVFRRRHMDVTTASDGEQALNMLQNELVDVMVLDIKMPGMSGLEVLGHVKKSFPSVEVILLSGHPSTKAALEGVRLGAAEYLKKPPDIEELAAIVRRLYGEKKRAHHEQQRKLIDKLRRRFPE